MSRSRLRYFVVLTVCFFGLNFFVKAEESFSPLRFGTITINRKTIFESGDKSDLKFPYSWANKLHVTTKEHYVREELLFKEGDVYNADLLNESERILRSRPVFRSVKVTVLPPENGRVNIDIETEDVWTTTVQLTYGVAVGGRYYALGFMERNFLGTGKSIGGFLRQDIDRFTRGLKYRDPHLLGSAYELSSGYGWDEKGAEWQVDVRRRYRSQLSTHGEEISVTSSSDEDRLFENGKEVAAFQHEERFHRFGGSVALAPSMTRAHHVGLVHEYEKDAFDSPRLSPLLPVDHTVSAALLTYRYQQARFVKKRGITTFDRDEDVNLGWSFLAEAGPSFKSWGATRDGGLGHVMLAKSWLVTANGISMWRAMADSRVEQRELRNAQFTLQSFNHIRSQDNLDFLFIENLQWGRNLDAETQFLLGGENGLRGYSVRQFSGSKKILLTAETRQTWVVDWLRLLNLGGALFVDSGGAWKESESVALSDFKHDVGVGLRLSPSKSFDPSLIRIDVAYALNDNQHSSRVVLNIGGSYYFGRAKEKKFDQ